MLIKIDARQLGALLAGLRLLQAHAADGYESPEILDVFADGRTADPLKEAEIEAICDGLEGGGLEVLSFAAVATDAERSAAPCAAGRRIQQTRQGRHGSAQHGCPAP